MNTSPNPIPRHLAQAALHALDHRKFSEVALFLDLSMAWMSILPTDFEDLWDAKVALECAVALSSIDPSLYAEGAIDRQVEDARRILERICGS